MNNYNFFFFFCLLMPFRAHAELNWTSFQKTPAESPVSSMQLAVNQNSKALLAWFQPLDQQICTAYYDCVMKKWDATLKIPATTSSITLLAVSYMENQKGGLLWLDVQNNRLYVSHLNQNTWSKPLPLQIPFPVGNVQSIFDSEGNLTVVWTSWNGLEQVIQGVFYSETSHNWTSITDLSPIGFKCETPKITLNSKGKGAIVWQAIITSGLGSATQSFVQMATFDLHAFQWFEPIPFGYDWVNTVLTCPDIVMDDSENIAVAWEAIPPNQEEKRIQYVLFSAKQNEWSYIYEMELGTSRPQWDRNAQNIELLWVNRDGLNMAQCDAENHLMGQVHNLAPSCHKVSHLKIAYDTLGKCNLLWLCEGTLHAIHYNHEWIAPLYFNQKPLQAFDFSQDALGNVVLAVLQEGQMLYAVGDYLLPPTVFEGEKIEVRYPSRKATYANLSWNFANSPNSVAYILRRDGALLTILPAHACQYTDYRCPNGHTKYELSVLNVDKIESFSIKRSL